MVPHALQLFGSLVRFVSQPFVTAASQLAKPVLHEEIVQLPDAQAPVPFAGAQGRPQPPQFCRLVVRLVSQPSVTRLSQLPNPPVHAMPQAPLLQLGVPLAVLQTFEHDPQLDKSVPRFASQPFEYFASQSWKPALHDFTVHAELRHAGVPF